MSKHKTRGMQDVCRGSLQEGRPGPQVEGWEVDVTGFLAWSPKSTHLRDFTKSLFVVIVVLNPILRNTYEEVMQ